jgi:sugar phosphate isomerase/epimerase
MKLSQVAAQLFTVRDFCQTAAGLAQTARQLRTIGYPAVQVSGVGPIPPDEIAAIMAGEGLTICATHEPGPTILEQTDKVIERLQRLGCKLTAYPSPRGFDLTSADSIGSLVRQLDAVGAKLRTAGITLGYHNHGLEFVPFQGAPLLDYLYAHTAAQNLVAELDTYWIQYGGGDPVEWCRKLRGRLPFIHLKDYVFTLENRPTFAEIGRGSLPFARIVAAAEQSGCQWFIVEQDICRGDPFDSLRISYDFIQSNLIENHNP